MPLSVRRAMLLAHTALQTACLDGAEAITDHLIDAAPLSDDVGAR